MSFYLMSYPIIIYLLFFNYYLENRDIYRLNHALTDQNELVSCCLPSKQCQGLNQAEDKS